MTPEAWRLLDLGPMTAAESVALDFALLEARRRGEAPTTLRFRQFQPSAVLVGYHQSVEREVDLEYCRRRGLEVNRRLTGGGAVYHDPDSLAWSIVSSRESLEADGPAERIFERLSRPVVAALARFNVQGRFAPSNDVEVRGRKISGMACADFGHVLLIHGTLLVKFNEENMARALKPSPLKLEGRKPGGVLQRVTCLRWESGLEPDVQSVKSVLAEEFGRLFGVEVRSGSLTALEATLWRGSVEKFNRPDWIHAGMDLPPAHTSRKEP